MYYICYHCYLFNPDKCTSNVNQKPTSALPTEVSCTLRETCTSLECCVKVPVIERNIQVVADLDACGNKLTLAVEKLQTTLTLLEYDFGTEEHVWISGVFRLRWTDVTIIIKYSCKPFWKTYQLARPLPFKDHLH